MPDPPAARWPAPGPGDSVAGEGLVCQTRAAAAPRDGAVSEPLPGCSGTGSQLRFNIIMCPQQTMVDAAKKETMNDITFRSDTVLSDVHLYTPSKRHLMVRLNTVGQPVFLSQFQLLLEKNNLESGRKREKELSSENMGHQSRDGRELCDKSSNDLNFLSKNGREANNLGGIDALLDRDGDLEVVRRPRYVPDPEVEDLSRDIAHPRILTKGGEDSFEGSKQENTCNDIIKIEHTMATPLDDVGKQVWRGAFLLADYILFKRDMFRGCTVLELGGGTGITSIVMAMVAKTVYCTDVGEDLLAMCEQNVTLNKHLTEPSGGEVKVKELDWLKDGFCTDPGAPYGWSEVEIADLHDHTTVLLAADVFYDDDLTDALFKTLYKITHNLKNASTIYLSIEKRSCGKSLLNLIRDLFNIRQLTTLRTLRKVTLVYK
ncbi:methyltransferase-like protein 22 isoform X3 [Carettochelys insculpta]|uniref:methyltransferase-like protein 22 isoform X3 n=1 Tax=Carettochelys insculpta TaxID=44489 RepID=UPI003EBDDA8B